MKTIYLQRTGHTISAKIATAKRPLAYEFKTFGEAYEFLGKLFIGYAFIRKNFI